MKGRCAAVSVALVLAVGVVPTGAQSPTTLTFTPAGNVGVNTPTPAFKLDVQGGQVNASGGLCIAGECRTSWSQVTFGSGLTLTDGNLGIGTTTPAYRLDVQAGQVNAAGGLCIAGDCRTSWGQVVVGSPLTFSNGNAGLGTTAPAYKLDVQGGHINASAGLCIAGDCRASWGQVGGAWGTAGTAISYNSGNVGIGTTLPAERLHVVGNAVVHGNSFQLRGPSGTLAVLDTSGPNPAFVLRSASAGVDPNISFQQSDGSLNGLIDGNGTTGFYIVADRTNLPIVLRTNEGNGSVDRVRVMGNGNVGIGTTFPTAKLHVAGNVVVDGNIAARYQDVAEWVEADMKLDAGTVVIADPERNNVVRASERAYDTAVAGVVSGQPGILLGEAGGEKIPVAQSGRVRVKVDASFGAIRRGDVLVSSPVAGYAMRSEPVTVGGIPLHRSGTILGKALEPWSDGKGEVLVLLTLQ